MLMVLGAACTWGTWSLFLRPTHLPGLVTAPIVFVVMFLVGLPISLAEPKPRWDRRVIALLLLHAVFDAFNIVCLFSAFDHTTVQIAILAHYATPILVALAAPVIDKTATPGARPAAVVALSGLVIVLEPWKDLDQGAIVGAALGFASAICYAGNVFVLGRLVPRVGAARTMSYHSLLSALLVLPFVWRDLLAIDGRALALVVTGAVLPGTLAGIVFSRGLARTGAARAAILTFAEPLVAVLVGALVWDEALHPLAAVGGAMILGAGGYVARKSG